MRRAGCFRARGKTQNVTKLKYNKIIEGIGYKPDKQTRRNNRNDSKEMDDSKLHSESDNEIDQKEQARAREDKSRCYVPRLGEVPQVRPEGVFCLLGGNLNSASFKEARDRKISDIHRLIKTWDVQGGGFSEGIDWRKLPQSKGLVSWFRTSHKKYWTATAHNTNKNVPTSIRQQGGISLFAGKELQQHIVKSSGDFRNLERWHSWIIQANPCHRTRLVVAYQVGMLRQKGPPTIYQQHVRYMQIEGITGTPRELFSSDFVNAILQWIEHKDCILLFLDANKLILTGKLPTALAKIGPSRSNTRPMGRIGAAHIRPWGRRTRRRSFSHTRHRGNGNHATIVP